MLLSSSDTWVMRWNSEWMPSDWPLHSKLKVMGYLTHWYRVTHTCVNDITSIGSDNGLSPGRRQAIIKTNAEISLISLLGTNFSEFLVEILIFSFKKMRLNILSRPQWVELNKLENEHALGNVWNSLSSACYFLEAFAAAACFHLNAYNHRQRSKDF